MPTIDTSKVTVGHGFLWTAPASTARPLDTLAELADPPSPWTYVGPTEEGVTINIATETGDIRVEEVSIPVSINVSAKNVRVRTSLSSDTIASLKLAAGGGTLTTVAAGASQPGVEVLKLSDTLDQLAAYFEVMNSAGFWRRYYIPKVLSLADVETRFRRSAANRAYPVELRAICLPSEIEIRNKTAAATS